ncbi:uncharacterized protein J3R85_017765 [Psidium guajava]|nr:uncharacterized protein J3R85_017765 [Psidium guajava]
MILSPSPAAPATTPHSGLHLWQDCPRPTARPRELHLSLRLAVTEVVRGQPQVKRTTQQAAS